MIEDGDQAAHFFGGAWTEAKLEIVAAYAKSFQTALKNQPFENWYIDPFAGTGERSEKRQTAGILQGEPPAEEVVKFAGSARRALEITPQFDHYRFADAKASHARALQSLAAEYSGRDIQVFHGDGNDCVKDVLTTAAWTSLNSWRQRGIVFLDPYGMSVRWETLKLIASTRKLDVWFLFAAKAVRQQLGGSINDVDQSKAAALDRFFGEPNWREEFFRAQEGQVTLFDIEPTAETAVNLSAIGAYARKRFADAFCWVSEPKSLTVRNVPDYFQLYCVTNNDSGKAVALVSRLHAGVVKAHEQASRHRFGR
jgi:three-Cys-motif partner protein